jgi:ATP-dependent helicase HepA
MWKVKQRLQSQTEPELGLGLVTKVDVKNGTMEVHYPQTDVKRLYSLMRAPLRRFILQVGQRAFDADSKSFLVEGIETVDGVIKYVSGERGIWEYELSAKDESLSPALTHFFSGHLSSFKAFDIRKDTWALKSKHLSMSGKGLLGARVEPIKHQLFIAWELSQRIFPRVLLADEVGLGKTIEAGLIFSRLRVLGRADKVLVLTPPSLVHQWVAEMYRRFGELFSILDEERSLEEESSLDLSPFESNQRMITSLDFLVTNPERFKQALEVDWDLIIIDEAHKLEWSEEAPNSLWLIAKTLSEKTRGLLLLTATPQQKGTATQFGLLNLVDPEKFSNFDDFLDNLSRMKELNQCVTKIQEEAYRDAQRMLQNIFPEDVSLSEALNESVKQNSTKKFIKGLIDRHGTGRVYFRNRRQRIQGFPLRKLCSVPLEASKSFKAHLTGVNPKDTEDRFLVDYATGRSHSRSFESHPKEDARFQWIREHMASNQEKVLIICASKERVEKLAFFLDPQYAQASQRKVGVFHEGLSILERDLQAAWFARDDRARALICSEIGGEGRNFQFVKKLILFDIPMHPDLLEQRIGRLDRIGQGKEIEIWVPWQQDTPEEVLFSWYDKGLSAFTQSWNGAATVLEDYSGELLEGFAQFLPNHPQYAERYKNLDLLVSKTVKTAERVRLEITDSIDSLIDINSFNEPLGAKLLESIDACDDDTALEFYVREIFDYYAVDYEDYDDTGSILVKGGSLSFIEEFPLAKKDEDITLTFHRRTALEREDMLFLTLDHPLIEATFDHMIINNEGLASICKWDHSPFGKGALIQLSLIIEAKGRKELQLDRYLPLTVKSILFNHKSEPIPAEKVKDKNKHLQDISDKAFLSKISDLKPVIMPSIEKIMSRLDPWLEQEKTKAKNLAIEKTQHEIDRLTQLLEINPLVRVKELEVLKQMQTDILRAISVAACRIDAIRVILTT